MQNNTPLRLAVTSADGIRHVMEHPARQRAWGVNELAAVIGCSPATISNLRTGRQTTVSTELAVRFSEAVGVETAVLFVPSLSTTSDTSREAS